VTRVAHLSAEYPKLSHTFIAREVDALRRRGVQVDTFTIRRTPPAGLLSPADRAEDAATFSVLPAPPLALARAHARLLRRSPARYLRACRLALHAGASGRPSPLWRLFYLAEAGRLADELDRRGIAHVHAHFVNVAGAVAMLATALRGSGASWSFTMHGPLEFDDVPGHAIPAKVRDAAFVACISEFCRAQLMRQVEPNEWGKLHVVRCGVRPEEYDAPARGPLPRGPLHLVAVGRLAPMKGFGVLLEAMAELPDARLTLVGDGPERAALEATAARHGVAARVRFAGALGAPGVTALLGEADVFCLPSFAEGVPVVLMEAMAARVPVVATAVNGIPELVADGRTGLLVAPGRAAPLVAAVRALAGDPERRRTMGAAGRAVVEEHYDVDRSVGVLARLLGAPEPAAPAPRHDALEVP